MSGTNDLINIIVGLLAGVDLFETDYPLDLASKNQALILQSQSENETLALECLKSESSELLH
jgi:hypothetical protein